MTVMSHDLHPPSAAGMISDAGGGGERVLWLAIKALAGLHSQGTPLHVVIYSGDQGVKGEEILARAQASHGAGGTAR